ncbi:hypothetical protein JZ751_019136 [Albula glossodonta]|uniref:Uncharacterized protein n=1 Tax=Albula glossodonta TaxID=121402 RepID=A0A8T2NMZ1_9TELE|nr:hypothetical protein JZ751_019136 [Albula glossodonta]
MSCQDSGPHRFPRERLRSLFVDWWAVMAMRKDAEKAAQQLWVIAGPSGRWKGRRSRENSDPSIENPESNAARQRILNLRYDL